MRAVDDETIRGLRRTLDTYTDGRALQALEALSAIRDDRALLHIHVQRRRARAKGKLSKRAAQILEDVRRQRGLSPDELEDRIVPELGLDEQGTMTLDYGPRQFTVRASTSCSSRSFATRTVSVSRPYPTSPRPTPRPRPPTPTRCGST